MARLNLCKAEDEEEEDLPDLKAILQASDVERTSTQAGKAIDGKTHQKEGTSKEQGSKAVPKCSEFAKNSSLHHVLESVKPLGLESPIFMPPSCSKDPVHIMDKPKRHKVYERTSRIRSTPRRTAAKPIDYSIYSISKKDRRVSSSSEDDESFTDLSGFIVPDSESDDGYAKKEMKPKKSERQTAKSCRDTQRFDDGKSQRLSPRTSKATDPFSNSIELYDPPGRAITDTKTPSEIGQDLSRGSTSLEDDVSQLKRPVTPPVYPVKSNLGSPSKRHHIPLSPHRPSIDAFWSQDIINDWNDQHSPKKTPHTPGRNRIPKVDESDESFVSPSVSPRKSPVKSPNKKERKALKEFGKEKAELAINFLEELDQRITNLQIAGLTAATGGIKIIWSKKLSSTAGRANWRREAVRRKNSDGTFSETSSRHHASIELAEKVIDCEERLINVLAHEYCHLANFMISGVKNQPHGREFNIWASKVTHAFESRGVEVTTKHGYDITYKYVWICGSCNLEYKRHSKSIDPAKHSCGACKGKLAQVLPVPRRENEYQRFVKTNWDRAKKSAGDGAGMGEINSLLAKEWEANKRDLERAKQLHVVEAEVAESASDDHKKRPGSPVLDSVARQLGLLTLRT